MNKKQLIIAWVMGIWISILSLDFSNDFDEFLRISIPVLIIGGLLIYTLRDKKE